MAVYTDVSFEELEVFLAAYALGFVAQQLSYQRGSALATVGLGGLLTSALPIVAGLALFGEPVPGGFAGILRIAGFIAVVVAAGLVAGPAAPAPIPTPAPPAPR